jgi:HK97 gp10 family phage protein
MADIKIVGLEKLQKKLKKNVDMTEVKRQVRKHGGQLQEKAMRNAPVGTPESTGIPGYVGGTLKRSIGIEITDGGMSAEVEPKADYGAYVELGTRKMEAQPYLKPAFEEQSKEFRKDMQKLVE